MKRYSSYLTVAIMTVMLISNVTSASEEQDYTNTINTFKQAPQTGPYFKNAYGYAVFPKVGKGGLGIGGAYGRGKVYQGGKATGKASLIKVSLGFQAGGQAFSEIIFFQDKRAYDEFTKGGFEFDAQASAVAITAGAQVQAGTAGATAGASAGAQTGKQAEINYRKGMAIFVHVRGGFMYEAAIAGQRFNYEAYNQ